MQDGNLNFYPTLNGIGKIRSCRHLSFGNHLKIRSITHGKGHYKFWLKKNYRKKTLSSLKKAKSLQELWKV